MIEFMLPAFLAGIGISLTTAPLGAFVVWRKMSYFGETLAHASLLGLALGFLLEINLSITLVVSCLLVALLLVWLSRNNKIENDSLLGVMAHTALSLGLLAIYSLDNTQIDIMGYLFGDLLSMTYEDLGFIYIGVAVILSLLRYFWQPLLAIVISEELAVVEGIAIKKMQLLLMALIATVVAVGMQFVGALMINALVIIPAATAHRFANSPEKMVVGATFISIFAVILGLCAAWVFDMPTSPSIVVCASILFFLAQLRKPV